MAEPTSTLTFDDLILEVARRIGVAYYGASGDGAAQIPVDAHDLAECKRHVNNAIRMFLADAPPNGWRWSRPIAEVVIWNTVSGSSTNTVSGGAYDSGNDQTTLTAVSASFYPTMEWKSVVVDGTTYTIEEYVSSTQIKVSGDASAVSAEDDWSITADNAYTLPATFGGEFLGDITYAADTNQGVSIEWVSEGRIRQWLEDITDESGDPYWAAVRPMAGTQSPRRRWELLVYPRPDEVMTLVFPYTLHFDSLVSGTEVPPAPFSHDETVKAACLAVAEKDVEGAGGVDWNYYRSVCLPNSYRIDSLSAPKRLGYFGDPGVRRGPNSIGDFRGNFYQRPTVSYNP